MPDEIEQRLAAAAQAAREYELCGQQQARLRGAVQAAAAELSTARQQYAGEQHDVERLEHLSLTRILSALHGSRDDDLAREKAEADAARYRVADAQDRLDAAQADLTRVAGRLAELAGAPQEYADALTAKEEYLTRSQDPRSARLLALAGERGRMTAELIAIQRTGADASMALQALAEVSGRLGTAANWSTFDTFLDHGMIANAIKHNRIDEAAAAARDADQRLARLRADLHELGGYEPAEPKLDISPGFRFIDIVFNNIFTDLAVGAQIRSAQDAVDHSAARVQALASRLERQQDAVAQQVNANETERRQLLTQ